MLTRLRISNFALLEELEVDFAAGLTFFTGETGAGKSILIDAICRLLGARATQDDIRAGASRAVLEAFFDTRSLPTSAHELLEEWQINTEEEELIVRREIQANGKSRSVINQCSVTLAQLRRIAPYLIDVFGQNEHQSLLDSDSQRALYDESVGIAEKVRQLSDVASQLASLQAEWKKLGENEQQRQRNIDILQYQIREIEEAGVSENEEEELNARRSLLQNSERIHALCESVLQDMIESDENILKRIESIHKHVAELEKFDHQMSAYVARFMEWLDELNELARKVDTMRQSLDFEEGSLDQIESRLDQYHKLKKKYGPGIADVLAQLQSFKTELNSLFRSEWRIEEVVQAARKAAQQYEELAAEITRARQAGAKAFSSKVEAELKDVALEKCRFRVVLERNAEVTDLQNVMEQKFPSFGRETLTFEIEPNPGEGYRNLARVASGGELSRLMLALKVVTRISNGHSLIFDEIDAGVGGRVAYQIGERLKRLSVNSQVLCVTHLAQVAAFGNHHFRVRKELKASRTITIVEPLAETHRIEELARMISGSEVTETALQHARELRQQVGTITG